MPRKPRIHLPGGIYHVILRGNGRQPIFFADLDRRRWMRLLATGIDRYRCRIHAFCWMTNHVHMAVQVSDLPLGLLVGWVASQYAKATNKRLEKSGHLFERRYRGKLVDADSYLLQLIRYIHRNPVVARMVDSPERYPWSSHRAYLGYRRPALLTTDWALGQFGNNRGQAIAAYRDFMAEEDQAPTTRFAGNVDDARLTDDDGYLDSIAKLAAQDQAKPSLTQLIEGFCRLHDVTEIELASPRRTRRNAKLRAEIALAAQQQGIATLHEVAERFNRSDSGLCHAIRNFLDSRCPPRQ